MSLKALKANPLAVAQNTSGGSVLMDVASGECFELNHVGSEIWSRLVGGEEVSFIASALAASYDVPLAQATADVEALVADLTKHGLLVVAGR